MYSIEKFNMLVSALFIICYSYQFIYCLIPFIRAERRPAVTPLRRYAVLIAARNEEAVISGLIDSLHQQTYPQEYFDIFVVADNCTDDTAQTARNMGARVYTRHNKVNVGKGYALEFLIDQIIAEYTADYYDGYFVFDADNLLEPDYIQQMNVTFCQGYQIVTSYRNSKNYGDNWISAGYGLWFLRESEFLNRSRHLMGVSACVGGTGFMFSKDILIRQNGWHYHLLTEDIQFAADNIAKGHKIGYCHSAVFYDEQPVKFSQSITQRLRWRKGYFQVVTNYGAQLVQGIFRGSFSCYDMLANIAPRAVLSLWCLITNVVYIAFLAIGGLPVMPAVISLAGTVFGAYKTLFAAGVLTTVTQWDKISCEWYKKILYTFTFPLFMFTYLPISVVALFARVSWRPISHTDSRKISDINYNRGN